MYFKEIETKYSADHISIDAFTKLIQPLNPEWVMVSSYDDYFTNSKGDFIRYRYNDHMGELTIKRKTTDINNNNRVEVNLPTQGKLSSIVTAFVDLLGYKPNFSIFKTCKIAILEKVILVYYVIYDENLNEKRRFIEVEANEKYPWKSEEEAWATVTEYEKILEPLGITPKHRLRKSLFELFKNDDLKI